MYKKIAFIGLFIIISAFSTSSVTSVENKYIKSGEELTFIASFKMSGIMTDIAEVKMTTSTVKTKTRELLRLKCTASTYSSWDSYFRVRDLYESYVNPETLIPSLFKRSIEEGTYKKHIKYLFKRRSKIAVSTLNKKGKKDFKTNVPIHYNTLDIVSTIYNIRTLNFDSFAIGKKVTKELIVDSQIETISVKYLGKESIRVGKYGTKECYKLSVGFYGKGLEKAKGGKYIWITADDDRLPALIKATIPIGTIQIRLSNFTK
ncbi:MAG: DUF3108 domain-containing protein [Flavobacteriaceae bacterium]|nr:DUF3108 domain-containing protein [Flavobacteriaceae bacterium]